MEALEEKLKLFMSYVMEKLRLLLLRFCRTICLSNGLGMLGDVGLLLGFCMIRVGPIYVIAGTRIVHSYSLKIKSNSNSNQID